jgi:hypothetical protein
MNLTRAIGYSAGLFLLEESHLQCQPARGRYNVDLEYKLGLRTFSHQVTEVKTLHDTFVDGIVPYMGEPADFMPNISLNWTQEMLGNLRNINHYAVLDTIVSMLAGSHDQVIQSEAGPKFPSQLSNGSTLNFKPVVTSFIWDKQGLMKEGVNFELRKLSDQHTRQSCVG